MRLRLRPSIATVLLFGSGGINFLAHYLFAIADANPLDSPISTEKGIITEIQDNAANNAISGGELFLGGSGGASTSLQGGAVYMADAAGNPFTHQAGVVFGVRIRVTVAAGGNDFELGINNTAAIIGMEYEWRELSNNFQIDTASGGPVDTGISIDTSGAISYDLWIALSNDGDALFYGDLEENGYATLWWVAPQEAISTFYTILWGRNNNLYTDVASIAQLATTFFNAPISVASPVVNTGSVSPGTDPAMDDADFVMQFDLTTLQSAGNLLIYFRHQDTNNCWVLRIRFSGYVDLLEKVGGTDTSRANTGIGAVSGGEVITLKARGNTIKAWYNQTQAWSYASANTFLRETDWTVNSLGTGGAISNLTIRKANARTQSGLGSELVTNGDFSAWTGDDPDGWTVTNETGPGQEITEDASGARVDSDGSAQLGLKQTILTSGTLYYYEVVVASLTAGSLQIRTNGGLIIVNSIGSSGTYSGYFIADNTQFQINQRQSIVTDAVWVSASVKQVQFNIDTIGNKLAQVVS